MIPRDYITEWREQTPWVDDAQVEQDLVISRAPIDRFSNEVLHNALAFRGGTALFKLHLPAARYSEDIDLVQVKAEPAGPATSTIRQLCAVFGNHPHPAKTLSKLSMEDIKFLVDMGGRSSRVPSTYSANWVEECPWVGPLDSNANHQTGSADNLKTLVAALPDRSSQRGRVAPQAR